MNTAMKIFLSMSCSGSLLILALFAGKRVWKDKLSRQWQYYVWLIVILRLLLPFGPETSLMGWACRAVEETVSVSLPEQQDFPISAVSSGQDEEGTGNPAENPTAPHPLRDIVTLAVDYLWLIWVAAALGMLVRKITVYQSFARYVRSGSVPVSDLEILDRLSITAGQAGIKRPVELWINPLISSPLLIGFFRPCIVLPGANIPEKDFQYIALHELTHYRRGDMFYKWLVQVTICLHWFNPFVYLMSREITKACEFSCDEAVLANMGPGSAREYGKTLLDAMAAVGTYRESLGTVTLSENKELLNERLGAIMSFRKKSKAIRLLTGVLTLGMIFGAAFIGVYPTAAAADSPNSTNMAKALPSESDRSPVMEMANIKETTYYLVQNEAQLRAIGTGKYGMDQNYMQQADIQLSADEWIPIGTWDNPFTGTFTGNGFEIVGLTMTDPDAEIIGLFGVAKNAHIYNVTLRDYDITSAGRNVAGKSVGAVLAVGQGSRSYNNFVYPADTKEKDLSTSAQAEKYYEAGSLPLFGIVFSRLDADEQSAWLDRIYEDGQTAFFSVSVNQLALDSPLIGRFAEKVYRDRSISFFSVLMNRMSRDTLEDWLDRALGDSLFAFQSALFNRLDMSEELDALEEELARKQMEEYKAVGVTMDGTNYYYKGQTVHIFLDQHGAASYTCGVAPEGTVNIRIVRGDNGKITGVAYMTEEEVTELLERFRVSEKDCNDDDWDRDGAWNWDWDDDDEWDWDEKALMAAYAAQGITKNGKSYYYQGDLVGVFLDQRADSSFYTLEINPKGTKHIKIIRSKSGEITGVAYMTEKEAAEFLEE